MLKSAQRSDEIIMIVNVDTLTKSILPLSNLSSSDEENVNCIINAVCLNENHIIKNTQQQLMIQFKDFFYFHKS